MPDPSNPANQPCANVEKSPSGVHVWIRRADGTAECSLCAVRLTPAQASEAFTVETSVSRKAGAVAAPKGDKVAGAS